MGSIDYDLCVGWECTAQCEVGHCKQQKILEIQAEGERLSTKVVNDRPSGVQYEVETWEHDGARYVFRRPNDGSKGEWALIDVTP
jgi:hypothetical protein